ncbi:MAG: M1 family metallopeptidase [Candidatus Binatia bacterium]
MPAAALAWLAAVALPASARGAEPSPAPVVAYHIEAALDPLARTVSGGLRARWRNPSASPVKEIYIHLYLNAFASNRTTLFADLRGRGQQWWTRHPDGWGRIDIAALRVNGADAAGRLAFDRPDDGNAEDGTLARLRLAEPVGAGEAVQLEVDFIATLPRLFMRSGHAAPFFFVAQWFPKIAGYRDGRWHAHQYHATGEFFADFGVYDVTLTVPKEYVVGHTGIARSERDNGNGTKTLVVRAENVHDFAWTADPRFRVIDDRLGNVPVRLLLQPHHHAQAGRYLAALRVAERDLATWVGPFPYPALTVVDPGPGGLGAAGMEYPMLITVGTAWWMPAGLRVPEMLAVHELAHQYWYGAVANDELNDAWLDEGITTFFEGLIMDAAYGRGSYVDLFGIELGAVALARAQYLAAGGWDPITTPSFRMLDDASYGSTAYAKTALVLHSLAGLVGRERLLRALREYYEDWRFRHPTAADLRDALAAAAGEELGPRVDELLSSAGALDYAVARVEVRPVPPPVPSRGEEPVPSAAAPQYRGEIVVQRRGELRLPVDILVAYDDGSETRETWDGHARWYRIDVTGTRRVAYARVDPDDKLPLDANRINNSRMREPGTRGVWRLACRWGMWLQGLLMVSSGL